MLDWLFRKRLAKAKLEILQQVRTHYFSLKRQKAVRARAAREKNSEVISPQVQAILKSMTEDPLSWEDGSKKNAVFLQRSVNNTIFYLSYTPSDNWHQTRKNPTTKENEIVWYYPEGIGVSILRDVNDPETYFGLRLTIYEKYMVRDAMEKLQAYLMDEDNLSYSNTVIGAEYQKVIKELLTKHSEDAAGYLTNDYIRRLAAEALE